MATGCDKGSPVAHEASKQRGSNEWFEDVTAKSGITFTHHVEFSGKYLYPEAMGSGAAFLDFDNDGRLDIYCVQNSKLPGAVNKLFHQDADGRFRDVSAGSGLDVTGQCFGVAVGDVNNDGLPDVFITEYDRVRLFLNLGQGKFRDITGEAGLTNRQWSVPAAFVDYDRDGWLDLVVGNYLDFDPTQRCPDAKGAPEFCGPHGFAPTVTRLYRNLGTNAGGALRMPRFEEVTAASALARAPGKAMEIVCADFTGDHWPDIFITDDGLPNRLFVNQRDGTFREEALLRGLAYTGMGTAAANMGIAVGDVDGDGLFDIFVPHLAEENHTFWRQGPRGVFHDDTVLAASVNLAVHSTGFGAVFADFDSDGAIDVAMLNGLVRRRVTPAEVQPTAGLADVWRPYADGAQLFAGAGSMAFRDVSKANPAFCGEAMVGRGLVCGDFDNDGASDLLMVGIGSPARLLRNAAAHRGHWLGLRVVDPALGNRDAYGAEVVVRGDGRTWWRLVQPAYSYASSNDPRVLFGLGSVTNVDSVRVVWPDGTKEEFPAGAIDEYRVIRKGTGRAPLP